MVIRFAGATSSFATEKRAKRDAQIKSCPKIVNSQAFLITRAPQNARALMALH